MEPKNDKEEEIIDFNKPSYSFKPNEVHEWRQQGPYLICKSCELIHAIFIGMDKIMTGTNNKGQPILKVRTSVSG